MHMNPDGAKLTITKTASIITISEQHT